MHRTFQSPHMHKQSSLDKTCRSDTFSKMKYFSDKNLLNTKKFFSLYFFFKGANKCIFQIFTENLRFDIADAASCYNNNIKANRKLQFIFTVSLPDYTLCPVSAYRISDLFSGCNSQAVKRTFVLSVINNGIIRKKFLSLSVKIKKRRIVVYNFCIIHNLLFDLFIPKIQEKTTLKLCGLLPQKKSITKSCSVLCSSACENLSAILSRHSLHKSVFFFSLELLRLICSFHRFFPPLK